MKFSKPTLIVLFVLAGFLGVLFDKPELVVGQMEKVYETFYGSPDDDPNAPANTLVAPWAEQQGGGDIKRLPGTDEPIDKKSTSLAEPHRPDAYLSKALEEIVARLFTIDPDNYEEHMLNVFYLFTRDGYEQYENYLLENGIVGAVYSRGMRLTASVESPPLLVKKASVKGVYRWVFDVPLSVSGVKKSLKDYKRAGEGDVFDFPRLLVQVQIRRVAEGGEEGVVIELIKIKSNRE
jgi:hypothetical protein